MIDSHELSDLKARCQYANTHGFLVGHAAEYAKQLAVEAGVSGLVDTSPAGLLWLIEQIELDRAAPVKELKAKAPESVKPKALEAKAKAPEPVKPKKAEPKTEEPVKAPEAKIEEPAVESKTEEAPADSTNEV